jgi:hypothetical protein
MPMNKKPYLVPALERGMRILELLAGHPDGLAMTDMEKLGQPETDLPSYETKQPACPQKPQTQNSTQGGQQHPPND